MVQARSTLKQVAAELGVSVATVSRALAGHQEIALRTRRLVSEKAKEMGYVPNSAGRMLVSGRSGFIGLVIPIRGHQLVDALLGEFVTGLCEGLNARGSDLFLATALGNQSELDVLKHMVESGRADATILTRVTEQDDRVDYLQSRRFPFVTHGRVLNNNAKLNWFDTDGEGAFADAFKRLYELGHRQFGFVSISNPMTFRYHREQGILNAIAECNDTSILLKKLYIDRFNKVEMRKQCSQFLQQKDRPTAVLALFDEIGLTLLEEANRLGINVPADLSVIGFDNIDAAAYAPPGLSTFDQCIRDSATHIANTVMDLVEGRVRGPINHLIKPKFISRASHGLAPTKVVK